MAVERAVINVRSPQSSGIDRRLFSLFADLLEYPGARLARAARECEALVAPVNEEAAALLRRFRAFVETTPPGRVEEVYTGTFDLDAACHPYVGYHLFGESYTRSVFLLGLKERYAAHGFSAGTELPDHLAVLLRFLATSDDAGLEAELIHEALLPALERMTGGNRERAEGAAAGAEEGAAAGDGEAAAEKLERAPGSPEYVRVLRALRLVLRQHPEPAGAA